MFPEGEPMSAEDLIYETMLILVGGDETTRHVMSGGLEALLLHPEQFEALKHDRSLLPGAIEEMLRWVTPVRNMNRTATVDVELGGQKILAGDRTLLLYLSGNRDEEQFGPTAHEFDIFRTPTSTRPSARTGATTVSARTSPVSNSRCCSKRCSTGCPTSVLSARRKSARAQRQLRPRARITARRLLTATSAGQVSQQRRRGGEVVSRLR